MVHFLPPLPTFRLWAGPMGFSWEGGYQALASTRCGPYQERRPFGWRSLHLRAASSTCPQNPPVCPSVWLWLRMESKHSGPETSTARLGSSPPPRACGSESPQHLGPTSGEEAEGWSSPCLDPSCRLFPPYQTWTQGLLCPPPGQPLAFGPRPEEGEDRCEPS